MRVCLLLLAVVIGCALADFYHEKRNVPTTASLSQNVESRTGNGPRGHRGHQHCGNASDADKSESSSKREHFRSLIRRFLSRILDQDSKRDEPERVVKREAGCPFKSSMQAKRNANMAKVPNHRRKRQTDTTCDSTYGYRNVDGTCNNLNNPLWGSNDQTFLRLLDPVYDDGVEQPRMTGANGGALPSPRSVSVVMHDFDEQRLSPRASIMAMAWGQFLAHDLTGTPTDTDAMTTDECCSDDLITTPYDETVQHGDTTTGGPCYPILIDDGDSTFTGDNRCMEFVRSYPQEDDDGKRQQLSLLSAYIDAGNVYGKDETELAQLRSYSEGKLIEADDQLLPESADNYCIKDAEAGEKDYCMEAGDSRVNVYPSLGALHTIFMRYHNYVAEQLAAEGVATEDEDIFQFAKKIVTAVIQRITYSEYLTSVIGSDNMATYGASDDYAYDDSCDATLYNVFATAAFRFGHSMVTDGLEFEDGVVTESVDLYNRPKFVLNDLDSVISTIVSNNAELADRWYSSGMTNHLFEEDGDGTGYDVAALNIQRGRDHGLPTYNDWREFCGFERMDFDDFPNHAVNRLQQVYESADDIDMYTGALTEASDGGLVGETYACLIGKQFQRLRSCDRFFWENEDTTVGFSSDRARAQITKTKLSHVICLTTGITSIQERVMRTPDDSAPEETCEDILSNSMDFSRFSL